MVLISVCALKGGQLGCRVQKYEVERSTVGKTKNEAIRLVMRLEKGNRIWRFFQKLMFSVTNPPRLAPTSNQASLLLDVSTILDGRILPMVEARWLHEPILIPNFVIAKIRDDSVS